MNSSFRVAIWMLSIALGLPLALLIGAMLLPNQRSHILAWHENNPKWGLHRGEPTSAPTETPATASHSPVVLVAELDSAISQDGPAEITAKAKPAAESALPASDPNLRRTHRAPVAFTARERTVPPAGKPGIPRQTRDENSLPENLDSDPTQPEPEPGGKPLSRRANSGPQLGDPLISPDDNLPQPSRRNSVTERNSVEPRGEADLAETALRSQSAKHEQRQLEERLEARLVGLQQQLDQLTQSQLALSREQQQSEQLQQAAQVAQQLQQQNSINSLEQQMQTLLTALEEIRKPGTKQTVSQPALLPSPAPRTIPEPFSELPASDKSTVDKALPATVSKLYRPQYISARKLQPLITPLLTPGTGRASVTGTDASEKEAELIPGHPQSQLGALLVIDLPESLRAIDEVVAKNDVPPPQVEMEATVLSVRLTEPQPNGVDLKGLCEGAPNHGEGAETRCGANGCVTPLATNGKLKWSRLQIDGRQFAKSLESLGPTKMISQPRIVVLNRQQICLTVGRKSQYRTASQGSPAGDVEGSEPGSRLQVRPVLAQDGLIRLEIQFEQSETANLPPSRSLEAATADTATQIVVSDGQTIVLGGLFEEQRLERSPANGGKPLVSLSWSKNPRETLSPDEKVLRSELIVLITPRLVRPPAAQAQLSAPADSGSVKTAAAARAPGTSAPVESMRKPVTTGPITSGSVSTRTPTINGVTLLPTPTELDNATPTAPFDLPARPAKLRVVPIPSQNPYSRVGLSLAPEESSAALPVLETVP